MWDGEVVSIHVASGAGQPMREEREVEAIAGEGLAGDRYLGGGGKFGDKVGPGRQVTLVETEAIEALEREYGVKLAPGESRRNILTRGVPLNHLVGRTFRVGEATLEGMKLCEPCGYLAKLTEKPDIKPGLTHRGGLRARIVTGGRIRAGDSVRPA